MFWRLWVWILALYTGWTWHFFTLICCRNCIVCLKRLKIKRKRGRGCPIFLKKDLSPRPYKNSPIWSHWSTIVLIPVNYIWIISPYRFPMIRRDINTTMLRVMLTANQSDSFRQLLTLIFCLQNLFGALCRFGLSVYSPLSKSTPMIQEPMSQTSFRVK